MNIQLYDLQSFEDTIYDIISDSYNKPFDKYLYFYDSIYFGTEIILKDYK